MKTKKGFIVKFTINGRLTFANLLPNEFHLVKTILNDSDNETVEVRGAIFTSENDFLTQNF